MTDQARLPDPRPTLQEVDVFQYAASQGDMDSCTVFLRKFPAAFDARDVFNATACMYAATAGKYDVIEMLIEKGADINAPDVNGWTALNRAVTKGHTEVMALLLNNGADPDKKDILGESALMIAVRHFDYKDGIAMIKTLLGHDVGIDPKSAAMLKTPRNYSIMSRQYPDFPSVLEKGVKKYEANELASELADFSPSLKRPMTAPSRLKFR